MKVAITGAGVISPVGAGREAFSESLMTGRVGIRAARLLEGAEASFVGGIPDFRYRDHIDRKGLRGLGRSTHFILSAVNMILQEQPGLVEEVPPDRIGVVAGTSYGHVGEKIAFSEEACREGLTFVSPMRFPNTIINSLGGHLGIVFQLTGPNSTISTGSSSLLDALRYSESLLETDRCDVVLAGVSEELNPWIVAGWNRLGQVSTADPSGPTPSVPFDRNRSGFYPAEGAACFLLEGTRRPVRGGAQLLAEGTGYGSATGPGSIRRAIERAFIDAAAGPEGIDLVLAAASGSPDSDREEAMAIRDLFPGGVRVCAVKSMTGEAFAASAGFQLAGAFQAMAGGAIPPTVGYREGDPDCTVPGVSAHRIDRPCRSALVVSYDRRGAAAIIVRATGDRRG